MTTSAENSKRKYFAPADLLVAAVAVLAFLCGLLALFGGSKDNLVAVVAVKGEVCYEISLSEVAEPYELTLEGEERAVLLVSSEGVRFASSDCPDKLCMNTGLLNRSGESAVCLPARVSVKLVSENGKGADAPDAVAG